MTTPARMLLTIVASTVALSACKREVAGGRADGPAVYKDACERCHGPGGNPPESLRAQLKVKDLASAEAQGRLTRELVEKQVREGSENKIMPAFAGVLTDAQISAVAEYVLTLGAD